MSQRNTPIRRSIEVEYWVIDEDGYLTEPGDLVSTSGHVDREFVEPLLEIRTTPCETTAELRQELRGRIRTVLDRAEERGLGLVPLATPLNEPEIRDRPATRTRVQDAVVGDAFEYVRHCAGTHIHFEQQPGAAVDQLNTLIALDPALALVNSAQHFQGRRLAAGARSQLYRRMAYDGMANQGELWPYVETATDWQGRLQREYLNFEKAAIEAGFDRRTVEAHFQPENTVWTPVRLRQSLSTVEWRSPDATLPSRIVRLADDIATVIEQVRAGEVRIEGRTGRLDDDGIVLPEFEAVHGYTDAAIKKGLASAQVRAYLERMGFDTDSYQPVGQEIDTSRITPAEARRLRLEHAETLKQDVRRRKPIATA